MKNADMPAMPTYELNGQNVLQDTSYGLTKREMFAIHAMQGLLSDGSGRWLGDENNCAKAAISHADALLAQLKEDE